MNHPSRSKFFDSYTNSAKGPDLTISGAIACWMFFFIISGAGITVAQTAPETQASPQIPILITEKVDDAKLVTFPGNTRPEANARNDRGRLPDNFPLQHIMLLLRRSPVQEQALEKLIDELHDSQSPYFHHWLTAAELGERYGLAGEDIRTITGWLKSHGFEVNLLYSNRVLIDFSGTAAQVREAFHTEIHYIEVSGDEHFANMSDPRIPAALAPAVVGVVSLNNFRPQPTVSRSSSNLTYGGPCSLSSLCYGIVPADLATIYNLNPILGGGVSGQGQTIALVEDSDLYSVGDWTTFRSTFGLSGYTMGSFTTIHPGTNCTDPGAVPGVEDEATLDAEWSSAAAPNAAILMVSCADGGTYSTFGWFIALQNLLSGTPPAIVSMSYGVSENVLGATANAAINTTYEQAVLEGVSVFVSAGDANAANNDRNQPAAMNGINISGFTTTPYNVSVGGTDFGETYAGTNSTYWSGTNGQTYGSALSYIPEIPWNDSCGSVLIETFLGYSSPYGAGSLCNAGEGLVVAGGSGGPSGCAFGAPSVPEVVGGTCRGYAKPSWQQGIIGNPNDGVRDVPDISLFAADGVWGHYYVFCFSDIANGGKACTGNPSGWSGAGGTSFAAPIMAAIQSLINQATGQRWGNPNPTYYSIAASEYGRGGNSGCNSTLGNGVASTCIFYDVTQGDMDVPCTFNGTSLNNCYDPGGTSSNGVVGVLSTSNTAYHPAYGTQVGWDFATGIGTVNAYNLEQAFVARSRLYKRATTLAQQVDYFGEGRADFTVWRPSNGTWNSIDGSGRSLSKAWGESSDKPIIGDYDGDGKTDLALWRASDGTFYVIQSSNGQEISRTWGENGDIPVPGDYNGNGKTGFAVWRPSNGTWYVFEGSTKAWGEEGDIPVPGDYDGDGKTDFAVWRPASGTWYILQSSNGEIVTRTWGIKGDIPVPGDYDGDGKTDIAIWRPSSGTWYVLQSSNGQTVTKGWGINGDVPVARDYDGDGKTDFAVWRPSNGTWYVLQSSSGKTITEAWGTSTDIPMNKPVGQ